MSRKAKFTPEEKEQAVIDLSLIHILQDDMKKAK